MVKRKKILAVSGSTRVKSSNLTLIRAIADLFGGVADFTIYQDIAGLPHFNPDLVDNEPGPVAGFKSLIRDADGVIICTPEYAHGVPGSLKNAIDWTVATSEFNHKPVLLITASTDGKLGHQAMLETLLVLEAEDIQNLNIMIPFINTKIKNDGIVDPDTKDIVTTAVNRLFETIDLKQHNDPR